MRFKLIAYILALLIWILFIRTFEEGKPVYQKQQSDFDKIWKEINEYAPEDYLEECVVYHKKLLSSH